MKEDKSSLSYKILGRDFPLGTNFLALVIGGAGSGKSYFTYNYLLPIMHEYFDHQYVIICSKTAGCDSTLNKVLSNIGMKPIIDPSITNMFRVVQLIRAQSLKTQILEDMIKHHTSLSAIKKRIVGFKMYPVIQEELNKLYDILEEICDKKNYDIIIRNPRLSHFMKNSESGSMFYVRDKENDASDREYEEEEWDEDFATWPVELINPLDKYIEDLESMPGDNGKKKKKNKKNDEESSDDESTTVELTTGIIIKRQIALKLKDYLIRKQIRNNLMNLYIAAKEVYGPTYQPVTVIVDDNSVSSELSNPNSQFTQLCLTRRHLYCSIIVLVQGVTYINTSIRRNATSYHLLPTMSEEDLKLIDKRLPKGLLDKELFNKYLENIAKKDRDQQMTHIFTVNPPSVIDGLPDIVKQYKI